MRLKKKWKKLLFIKETKEEEIKLQKEVNKSKTICHTID